jgi:ectoine hydroxylase-related dioxygenase (phytanoyl-CoA dioxygenase family)
MPSVVLPGLAERFRREGYVVIPNVFTPAELDLHAKAVDRFVQATTSVDGRIPGEKRRFEQSTVECNYLWTSDADVRALSCHPRLANIAAVLLGTSAVRMWQDQAVYRPPGGRRTVPHQDHPYWPILETDQVTAWIPFEASDRHNGTVAYYPGSHRLGLDRFVDSRGDDDADGLGADPALRGVHPVLVEVPVGSVAFHHGLTAHFALANQSRATRRVHTVAYLADGCHRSGFRPHPCVELDGIGDGHKVDGAFTPVLWPRPDGDLPEPPPDADARLDQFWRHVYGRSRQSK